MEYGDYYWVSRKQALGHATLDQSMFYFSNKIMSIV